MNRRYLAYALTIAMLALGCGSGGLGAETDSNDRGGGAVAGSRPSSASLGGGGSAAGEDATDSGGSSSRREAGGSADGVGSSNGSGGASATLAAGNGGRPKAGGGADGSGTDTTARVGGSRSGGGGADGVGTEGAAGLAGRGLRSAGGAGGAAGIGGGNMGGRSRGAGGAGAGGASTDTGGAAATGGNAQAGGGVDAGTPPERTVRVLWLRPSDVPDDTAHPEGIAKVMKEAQRYYQQELGKTFKLNEPVVETVTGEHVKSWYENTANGSDKYWWSVFNMQQELMRRLSLKAPDSRWVLVGEVSAEGDGAGGGGGNGWVILCQHDADGAAGIGATMNRWYGGMVHELGHALGLPDSTSTDGTPMSGSFYEYPNCHFNQSQKDGLLKGRFSGFLF